MRPSSRTIRATVLALATALLAGPLALGPAALADTEAPGLERPYGDELEPGTSFSDTAEVGPGTYTLNIPAEGEDHYFEIPRTDPDAVIWYGVTLQLEDTADDLSSFTVEGTAEGDSTVPCNSSFVETGELSYVTALYSANRTGECRAADSITLRVANGSLGEDGEALPTDAYYQLVVWTEPPVEDTSQLPAPNENSPWVPVEETEAEPTPVEGARTFTDAEDLADGYYSVTVEKGRPSIFAFPLTYGQHVQVLAENDGAADTFETLDAVWVSPLGGRLRDVEPSGGPGSGLGLARGDQAGWSTPIVTYTNRQRAGGVGASQGGTGFGQIQAAPAAFAGTYYLVVELPRTFGDPFPDELPLLLDVRTITDYEGSPPDYAAEPAALQSLDGSGYVATEEERQEAQEADAEPAPWPLVIALFVGAALLAAVGGVAVGRVVRSRS